MRLVVNVEIVKITATQKPESHRPSFQRIWKIQQPRPPPNGRLPLACDQQRVDIADLVRHLTWINEQPSCSTWLEVTWPLAYDHFPRYTNACTAKMYRVDSLGYTYYNFPIQKDSLPNPSSPKAFQTCTRCLSVCVIPQNNPAAICGLYQLNRRKNSATLQACRSHSNIFITQHPAICLFWLKAPHPYKLVPYIECGGRFRENKYYSPAGPEDPVPSHFATWYGLYGSCLANLFPSKAPTAYPCTAIKVADVESGTNISKNIQLYKKNLLPATDTLW